MGIQYDRRLLEKLCAIDHGLTEWEMDFIDDTAKKVFDKKKALTEGQLKMAKTILKEKG